MKNTILFFILLLFSVGISSQSVINFEELITPIIFKGDNKFAYRDPAVVYNDETFFLYFTLSEIASDGGYYNMIAYSKSTDLAYWSFPKIITPRDRKLNYSSPGNIIKYNNEWVMCFQSYPTPNQEIYGNETSRLFIMKSDDLENWREPEILKVKGNDVAIPDMGRMIDPYLIKDENTNKWWCFYKQNGVSMSYSDDLKNWTYCGHRNAGENVTVIKQNDEFVMFHSPENGIGVKRSKKLYEWGDDVQMLTFDQENWGWADERLTAATVIDLTKVKGIEKYIMFFHGETGYLIAAHGQASMAVAWSDDLINWDWPKGHNK